MLTHWYSLCKHGRPVCGCVTHGCDILEADAYSTSISNYVATAFINGNYEFQFKRYKVTYIVPQLLPLNAMYFEINY